MVNGHALLFLRQNFNLVLDKGNLPGWSACEPSRSFPCGIRFPLRGDASEWQRTSFSVLRMTYYNVHSSQHRFTMCERDVDEETANRSWILFFGIWDYQSYFGSHLVQLKHLSILYSLKIILSLGITTQSTKNLSMFGKQLKKKQNQKSTSSLTYKLASFPFNSSFLGNPVPKQRIRSVAPTIPFCNWHHRVPSVYYFMRIRHAPSASQTLPRNILSVSDMASFRAVSSLHALTIFGAAFFGAHRQTVS